MPTRYLPAFHRPAIMHQCRCRLSCSLLRIRATDTLRPRDVPTVCGEVRMPRVIARLPCSSFGINLTDPVLVRYLPAISRTQRMRRRRPWVLCEFGRGQFADALQRRNLPTQLRSTRVRGCEPGELCPCSCIFSSNPVRTRELSERERADHLLPSAIGLLCGRGRDECPSVLPSWAHHTSSGSRLNQRLPPRHR